MNYTCRTPLHCAASLCNIKLIKLLVENGACVFAMASQTSERPVDKCKKDSAAYGECIDYLKGNDLE